MIVAGCDVGSLTAKALILKDGSFLAASIIPDKSRPEESAMAVIAEALSLANLSMDNIDYIMGTGYGRKHIPFVNDVKSEISCHAKGAWFLLPSVSTVIDIGGQDCKVTKVEKDGKVAKFITNDKCAAGTGRFLEVMAQALGVPLEEMGELSKKAKKSQALASICTVWAQAEVIRMINDGLPIPDIGASVNEAMASRVALIANTLGIEKDVCMTGGVSKNVGVVKSLEQKLGVKIKKPGVDPQLVGALGAALFAQENLKKGK